MFYFNFFALKPSANTLVALQVSSEYAKATPRTSEAKARNEMWETAMRVKSDC